MKKRKSKVVRIGDLKIGGDELILVQSMVNADAHDVSAVVRQIKQLEEVGCQIVRIGVLDMESVQNIGAIKKQINIPLVADIHFNYEFALEAIRQGVDKVRINPGNIGSQERVVKVVEAAKTAGVPLRIGVNTGSIEREILMRDGKPTARGLVDSALGHVRILENLNFDQIVISVKASDVRMMVEAYRILANEVDYPLHLGVTEAGTERSSTIKSAMGIGSLLLDGIGDTLRVSLTGDPVEEVKIGRDILKYLGIGAGGPILISCPTCSRTQFEMIPLAKRVEEYLEKVKIPIKVAVMGCAVNGPGEARECDIGVAGGKGIGVIFEKGEVVATVPEEKLFDELKRRIDEFVKE